MKKVILIFAFSFLLLANKSVYSSVITDSLEHKLAGSDGKEKLVLLHDLIWEYFKTDPSKSIVYGNQSIQLATELNDSAMLAYSYRYTGIAYKKLGLYDKALHYYFRNLEIIEQLGDSISMAKTYNSIGNIYGNLGKLEDAKAYLKRVIEIAERSGELGMLSRTTMGLGIIYHRNNQMDSTFLLYQKAKRMSTELNNLNDLALVYNNIGLYYSDLNQYDSSLFYYQKSLELREGKNDQYGMANLLNNIGAVYLDQGNYDKAFKSINESRRITEKIGAIELQQMNYQILSSLFELTGNSEKALYFHKLYHALSDSIFNEESDQRIAQMVASQKMNEQIKHNEQLQKSNQLQVIQISKQKNYALILIIIIGAAVLIIGFLIVIYRYKKRNLDLLSNVINSLTHPFYVVNAKDFTIDFANDAAKVGEFPAASRCKSLKSKIDKPCTTEDCKCTLKNLASDPKPYKVESRSIMKDGKEHFYELYGFPIVNSKGKLEKVIEYNRDITKRKQAEIKLEASEKELRLSNEAKDKLFSILAHDIRNPFSFMIGISETLMEHHDDLEPDEIQEIYKRIHHTSTQTHKLFEHLMDWAQSQSDRLIFEPRKFSLSSIVKENVELLEEFAKDKQIELEAKCDEDKFAFADENMVKTILRNLTLNAIKFTRNGGIVKIETKMINSHAEVSVIDNGIGIPESIQENLFSAGNGASTLGTAKEKGLGIGLILTKELVSKCNGEITVESEPGKGSKFTFTLPVKS